MNRSLKVGLLWIALVTALIAAWLALQPTSSSSTASGPVAVVAEREDNDSARAPRAAVADEGRAEPAPSVVDMVNEKRTIKKRATRTATAVALQRRLELAAAVVAEAQQQPTGKLERQAIKDGVAVVKPEIVGCYDQALAQSPELAGTLKVLFEIGPDPDDDSRGLVVAGEVDSAMGSPFFEACVLQAIVGADFPRPDGGIVKVTYPFTFKSDADVVDAGP
jgi:hypothetical protein